MKKIFSFVFIIILTIWTISGQTNILMPQIMGGLPTDGDIVYLIKKNERDNTKFDREIKGLIKKSQHYKFGNWARVELNNKNQNELKRILKNKNLALYISPDIKHQVILTPNDPLINNQWALTKTEAFEAWGIAVGSENVIVGIVDTGILLNHPDLFSRLYFDVIDGTYGYNSIGGVLTIGGQDDHGHGTHVAGIVAATINNNIGVVGIAPNTKLMAFKFLDNTGSGYTSDALILFDKIIELKNRGINIKILNNSWGTGIYDLALEEGFKALEAAGILSIAASGNSNLDVDFNEFSPATLRGIESLIVVNASDVNDNKAYFSNYGLQKTTISAPGLSIFNTLLFSGPLSNESGYGYLSGTSMAAPHVAGLAALISSLNPALSPIQIKQVITHKDSHDPMNDLLGQASNTGGRINIKKTVNNIVIYNGYSNANPVITFIQPTNKTFNQGENVLFEFSAIDPDGDELKYIIIVDGVAYFTNRVVAKLGETSKDRVVRYTMAAFDSNGGNSYKIGFLNALTDKNRDWGDIDANISVRFEEYQANTNYNLIFITMCPNNTSEHYWTPWANFSYEGGWSVRGSGWNSKVFDCFEIGYIIDKNERLCMVEIIISNDVMQEKILPRFYFRGTNLVENPAVIFPRVEMKLTPEGKVYAPATVGYDLSRTTPEDVYTYDLTSGYSSGDPKVGTRHYNSPENTKLVWHVITRDGNSTIKTFNFTIFQEDTNTPTPCDINFIEGILTNITVDEKYPLEINVQAIGTPPINYEWYKNGNLIQNGGNSYIKNPAQLSDAGIYTVVAKNDCKEISIDINVEVIPCFLVQNPRISPNGFTNVTGSTILLTVSSDSPANSYTWYKEGLYLTSSNTFTKQNATTNDSGNYRAQAVNYCGATNSPSIYVSITNIIAPPPELVLNPANNLTTSVNGRNITLRWTDNSIGEDRYEIEVYYKVKNLTYPFRVITTLPANANSYIYTAPTTGANYSFRVRAAKNNQYAPYSNISNIRVK